jgi:hypothetical protein
MGVLDAFGSLASAVIAAVVMLVFAILSVFVTVFIVDVAAGIADLSPDDGFVVLGGTIIAAAAILAGGTGFATPEEK